MRRNRGHVEPPMLRKLRLGLRWDRNDINGSNHSNIARFLAFSPQAVQDETMGRLLRAELPSWYFTRIMDAYKQINDRQRRLAAAAA